MTEAPVLAALLALAVVVASVRLLLWWRQAPVRSAGWRVTALLVLQPIWAGLLWTTLLPPRLALPSGALVVLTRDWRSAGAIPSGRRVALPEAQPDADAERVPDLVTALRRHPGTTGLRIVGAGLPPRDRGVAGLPLAFDPTPLPRGLVRLDEVAPVGAGADFAVTGQVSGVRGSAELVDPAGARADAQALPPSGAFRLVGSARGAGLASFTLNVRDAGGTLVERAAVPLRVVASVAPRLLLLGTPGPEPKYLRRWATDAGLPVEARLAAGGGIVLGDAGVSLGEAALRRYDVAVIDDRSWAGLDAGARAALIGAVRGGLGLLLRVTGPLPSSVAGDWRRLGFALGGGALVPLRLPGAPVALSRSAVRIGSGDSVPFLSDPAGEAIGRWRVAGQGRAGVWTPVDSYALVLTGARQRYGTLWAAAIEALARPQGAGEPTVSDSPAVGERVAICPAPAMIVDPQGHSTGPIADPAAGGCGAFWPTRGGWHVARPASPKASPRPFYVRPADELRGVRAAMDREATMALVGTAAARPGAILLGERGPAWPWFLGFLAASGLLWWLERARAGRAEAQGSD